MRVSQCTEMIYKAIEASLKIKATNFTKQELKLALNTLEAIQNTSRDVTLFNFEPMSMFKLHELFKVLTPINSVTLTNNLRETDFLVRGNAIPVSEVYNSVDFNLFMAKIDSNFRRSDSVLEPIKKEDMTLATIQKKAAFTGKVCPQSEDFVAIELDIMLSKPAFYVEDEVEVATRYWEVRIREFANGKK